MNVFVPVYFIIGICWGALLYRYHPLVQDCRKKIGDERMMLALLPVVFLWPVEAVGFAVYLLLMFVSYMKFRCQVFWMRVSSWRGRWTTFDDIDWSKAEFVVVCHVCGASHKWVDADEAAAAGWKYMTDETDDMTVYWFCERCEVHGHRGGQPCSR